MKWTTILDFLDFIERNGADSYDRIVLQLGIVDWSPRPQNSAIADLYDNQSPNNIGNDNLNTREYARKVVNNKKAMFDAVFGAEAMQAHLATPLGVEFEGQPTANMYSLEMAKQHLLPRLVAMDKLIFVTSNRFVPGWQGDHARGRPANIGITEAYAEAFRDALGPNRVVDLLKWSNAEVMQYTCDNIHLTKQGSDFVYDALCELMNLPNSKAVSLPAKFETVAQPKAPAPLSADEQRAARSKVGVPEGQPLATLIIGVRFADGDRYRLGNLETLLRQIDQTYGDLFDVLIVEQDRLSKFKSQRLDLPASVRHEFIYNPFEFNRGWGYNVAVKRYADSKVVALLDTDVLLGDNFLDEILACHDQYKVISPYQNVYFTTEAEAEPLRGKTGNLTDFSQLSRESGVGKPTTISGGIVIMQRELYLELGGFEQYTSYGGEDRALDVAILATCSPNEIRVAAASYVHLYHPPAPGNSGALRAILAHLDQNYGCRVDRTLAATDYIHRNCTHVDKLDIARLVAQRAASFGDIDLYQFGHTLTINGMREATGNGNTRTNAIFPPEFSNLRDYEAKELYKAPPPDSEALASLYNKFRGERCFIIGNGPSLNRHDLALLKDEYTFAVNSIFYKTEESGFRPTFFVVEDNMVMRDNIDKIREYHAPYKFFPTNYKSLHPPGDDTYFFRMNRGFYEKSSPYYCVPRFSTDASSVLYCGQSVTYINLQLAYFMGFTEVHLIGMDFDYVIPPEHKQKGDLILSAGDDPNHFHKDYFGAGKTWKDPKLDRVGMNYREAKAVYEAVGRKIYNSTIGGKLEIFERADYNALFSPKSSANRPGAATAVFPESDIKFGEAAKVPDPGSPETAAVERLYNLYKGKRCFILADGATLSKRDADQLADEFTFGTDVVKTGIGGAALVPSFLVVDGTPTLTKGLDRARTAKAAYNFLPIEAKGSTGEIANAFYLSIDRNFDVRSSLNYRVPRFSTDASKGVFSGTQSTFIATQLAFFMGFTEVYVLGTVGTVKSASADFEQARVAFEAVGRTICDATRAAVAGALEPIDLASLFVGREPTGARQLLAARQNSLPPGSGAESAVNLEPRVPFYAPFGNWLNDRSPRAFQALRSARRAGQRVLPMLRSVKRYLPVVASMLAVAVGLAVLPALWQPLWDLRFWLWSIGAVVAVAMLGLATAVLVRQAIRALNERLSAEKRYLVARDKAIHQRLGAEVRRLRAELDAIRNMSLASVEVVGHSPETARATGGQEPALPTLEARISEQRMYLIARDKAIHQRFGAEVRALKAEIDALRDRSAELEAIRADVAQNATQIADAISSAAQDSAVEVVSALRAISKIWFHDASMPVGTEFEHGHALLMKTMAAQEVRSPGTLRGKTLTEVGTTREHLRSQGSTSKLAIFTGLLGMDFTTVDMDPANTEDVAGFIRFLNPTARALTAKGEDYLAAHEGPLDYVYLDAFDFYHDNHSAERQSRYQEFLGTDINDEACWEMHRACADAIVAKMSPGGLVALDDTWTDANGNYDGKGKLAIPLLLQHDFDIVAMSTTTVVLQRRSSSNNQVVGGQE